MENCQKTNRDSNLIVFFKKSSWTYSKSTKKEKRKSKYIKSNDKSIIIIYFWSCCSMSFIVKLCKGVLGVNLLLRFESNSFVIFSFTLESPFLSQIISFALWPSLFRFVVSQPGCSNSNFTTSRLPNLQPKCNGVSHA